MTICERLIEGESLRAICTDPVMPEKATVLSWISQNKEFRKLYASAREFQANCISDDAIDVADDASGDWVEKVGANGRVMSRRAGSQEHSPQPLENGRAHLGGKRVAGLHPQDKQSREEVGGALPGGFPPEFSRNMKRNRRYG
jgi:hypothetical protein